MQSSTFTLTRPDGTEVFVHRWLPEDTPKAIVQIAHGLAEHSGRYARFAETLTDHGYAVYASDHRGHGRTSGAARRLRPEGRLAEPSSTTSTPSRSRPARSTRAFPSSSPG